MGSLGMRLVSSSLGVGEKYKHNCDIVTVQTPSL